MEFSRCSRPSGVFRVFKYVFRGWWCPFNPRVKLVAGDLRTNLSIGFFQHPLGDSRHGTPQVQANEAQATAWRFFFFFWGGGCVGGGGGWGGWDPMDIGIPLGSPEKPPNSTSPHRHIYREREREKELKLSHVVPVAFFSAQLFQDSRCSRGGGN